MCLVITCCGEHCFGYLNLSIYTTAKTCAFLGKTGYLENHSCSIGRACERHLLFVKLLTFHLEGLSVEFFDMYIVMSYKSVIVLGLSCSSMIDSWAWIVVGYIEPHYLN